MRKPFSPRLPKLSALTHNIISAWYLSTLPTLLPSDLPRGARGYKAFIEVQEKKILWERV